MYLYSVGRGEEKAEVEKRKAKKGLQKFSVSGFFRFPAVFRGEPGEGAIDPQISDATAMPADVRNWAPGVVVDFREAGEGSAVSRLEFRVWC